MKQLTREQVMSLPFQTYNIYGKDINFYVEINAGPNGEARLWSCKDGTMEPDGHFRVFPKAEPTSDPLEYSTGETTIKQSSAKPTTIMFHPVMFITGMATALLALGGYIAYVYYILF